MIFTTICTDPQYKAHRPWGWQLFDHGIKLLIWIYTRNASRVYHPSPLSGIPQDAGSCYILCVPVLPAGVHLLVEQPNQLTTKS